MAKGREITNIEEAEKYVDYRQWFSDKLAKDYIETFPKRFSAVSSDSDRQYIYQEAQNVLTMYSLLVYYTYSQNTSFRKAIDSNKEFRSNFAMIKKWLEQNNGKQIADSFIGTLKAQVAASA
ncbi:hypothetical protein FJZ26_02760 [Candidatus Parvarchaeota archaeon]|nr:hypothetical protein [Candidatus Parvarchaeota archaeon]